ncbi:MAG: T9SS type A sorting domain-containing protein [candidate division WOR-3 bacterium]
MKLKYFIIIMPVILVSLISAQPLRWVRIIDGPGPTSESIMDAVMDNALNVYVTGLYSNVSSDDIRTVKYAGNGNVVWDKIYDAGGADGGVSICLDNEGYVYVAGWKWTGIHQLLVILKYNGLNGELQWSSSILMLDPYQNDICCRIAVDDVNGCGYVATQVNNFGDYDGYLCQFNIYDGSINWGYPYTYVPGSRDSWRDIVIGSNGYVYVTGYADDWYHHTITAKYNLDGVREEVADYFFDSGGSGIDRDNNGYLYVICAGVYGGGYKQPTVLKYDENLNLIWRYILPDRGRPKDIVVHRTTGTSYVAGCVERLEGGNWYTNALTFAVNTSGSLIWNRIYGNPYLDEICEEVAITNNCVYASGYAEPTNTNCDILTLCYTRSNGAFRWAGLYDYNGGDDESYAISVKTGFTATNAYIVSAGKTHSPLAMITLMYSYNELVSDTLSGPQGGESPIPQSFYLKEIYPNPTNGELRIRFNTQYPQKVGIRLYDATGRLIAVIFDGEVQPGLNEVSYLPGDIANGIYFVQIITDGYLKTEKIIYKK